MWALNSRLHARRSHRRYQLELHDRRACGHCRRDAIHPAKEVRQPLRRLKVAEGRLRGLRLDAGGSYRDPTIIGYRRADKIVNPANLTAAIEDPSVDAFTPIYSSGYTLATATIGYSLRLAKNRPVELTLRVDNALDESEPH